MRTNNCFRINSLACVFAIIIILSVIISGCDDAPSKPEKTVASVQKQRVADPGVTTKQDYKGTAEQQDSREIVVKQEAGIVSNDAPDKFSLWTGGTVLRGVNIYQRVVYPDGYDDPEVWGSGPLGPVFTQDDFDALAKAGANFVVLSHAGIFDDRSPYSFNMGVQDNLDRFISMAEEADLFVVIAFRTGPGRSEFAFFGVEEDDEFGMSHLNNDVWTDDAAQAGWAKMWKQAAARYKDNPVVIGYDLMVEPDANGFLDIYEPEDFYPDYKGTTHDWNRMSSNIIKSIREVDEETPIIVGGLSWSNVRWLQSIEPTGDDRTVYAVHQYAPQQEYTHQCPDAGDCELINSYPGRFNTDWEEDEEDFGRDWLVDYLTPIKEFRAGRKSPVVVTEYGVIRWEPGAEDFLDDEMGLFEGLGVNYAVWSWQPISDEYTEAHNSFNFRLGSNPEDRTEDGSGLYDVLKKYWAKNSVRPSTFT
jgi:hypothetical protein